MDARRRGRLLLGAFSAMVRCKAPDRLGYLVLLVGVFVVSLFVGVLIVVPCSVRAFSGVLGGLDYLMGCKHSSSSV